MPLIKKNHPGTLFPGPTGSIRESGSIPAPIGRMQPQSYYQKNQEKLRQYKEQQYKEQQERQYKEKQERQFEQGLIEAEQERTRQQPKQYQERVINYTLVDEQTLSTSDEYIYNNKNIGRYQGKTEDGVFVFEYFILRNLSGLIKAVEHSDFMNINYYEGNERDTYLREREQKIKQKKINDEDARLQKIDDDEEAKEERENLLKEIAESMATDEFTGDFDRDQFDNYLTYVTENQEAIVKDINKIMKKIGGFNNNKFIMFAEKMKRDIRQFILVNKIINDPYEGFGSDQFEREYLTEKYDKYKDYYLLHGSMDGYMNFLLEEDKAKRDRNIKTGRKTRIKPHSEQVQYLEGMKARPSAAPSSSSDNSIYGFARNMVSRGVDYGANAADVFAQTATHAMGLPVGPRELSLLQPDIFTRSGGKRKSKRKQRRSRKQKKSRKQRR